MIKTRWINWWTGFDVAVKYQVVYAHADTHTHTHTLRHSLFSLSLSLSLGNLKVTLSRYIGDARSIPNLDEANVQPLPVKSTFLVQNGSVSVQDTSSTTPLGTHIQYYVHRV